MMNESRMIKQWPIDDKILSEWKCLNPEVPRSKATDCVINSLAFVSMIEGRQRANELSDEANREGGTYVGKIFEILFQKYTNEKKSHGTNLYSIESGLKELYLHLGKSSCTLAIFFFSNFSQPHCVIVARSLKNELIVVDPQQETMRDIYEFCKTKDVVEIKLLVEKRVKSRDVNIIRKNKERGTKKIKRNPPLEPIVFHMGNPPLKGDKKKKKISRKVKHIDKHRRQAVVKVRRAISPPKTVSKSTGKKKSNESGSQPMDISTTPSAKRNSNSNPSGKKDTKPSSMYALF